ncbi:unnamed protein product [Mytilus edulis]|uniref:DUF6589 domain-containing protein n=1 Tax=Mytilus edulis TaxID=6550 RepID=A0A8S3U7I1_MYTED|nr:unnamed protein product [Mytilus edulis]
MNICLYKDLQHLQLPETNKKQKETKKVDSNKAETEDHKLNYSCSLLRDGLYDWIREDASKENDGDRLVRMWRLDILKYTQNNHTKYRLLSFRLQAQLLALLPPKLAHQLRHNRGVNIHGGAGKNVPGDLALEFLNMRAKDSLNSLSGNLSSSSIQRCGRSLQGCNDLIDSYTEGLQQFFGRPSNSKPSIQKDINSLVEELAKENLFDKIPGRCHHSFQNIINDETNEAKENSNFDEEEEEVIATLGKLVQKQTLFEDLNEQILKLTEPENVENEIIDSDEYSVDMETKIRHIRKFIQNVQTPQSHHIDSHATTQTLNPETIPFVPTHIIANPHNAQSFENPSVQASHTFNTQQKYNPADLLTRGIDADQYINSVIWKKGPNWLTNRTKWPEITPTSKAVLTITGENDDEEFLNNDVHTDYYGISNIIDISKYGTFRKLIRVTAYVHRFISNCRFTKHLRKSGVLTTNDINTAVRSWILDCQKSSYSAEIKSLQDTRNKNTMKYPRIRQLGLFIDDDGLVRCNGRIHNAPISENTKFPYLIPANHPLTKLIEHMEDRPKRKASLKARETIQKWIHQ